jgi:hypothetical protein
MHRRGEQYWRWSDCQLECVTRRAMSIDGTQIEIRGRTSRESITQLFVGIYRPNGLALAEEFYPHCAEESLLDALDWGLQRGHYLVDSTHTFTAPHRLVIKTEARAPVSVTPASEEAARATFLLNARLAREAYDAANRKVMEMMKKGDVLGAQWDECRAQLNRAIDSWSLLPRTYVSSPSGDGPDARLPVAREARFSTATS